MILLFFFLILLTHVGALPIAITDSFVCYIDSPSSVACKGDAPQSAPLYDTEQVGILLNLNRWTTIPLSSSPTSIWTTEHAMCVLLIDALNCWTVARIYPKVSVLIPSVTFNGVRVVASDESKLCYGTSIYIRCFDSVLSSKIVEYGLVTLPVTLSTDCYSTFDSLVCSDTIVAVSDVTDSVRVDSDTVRFLMADGSLWEHHDGVITNVYESGVISLPSGRPEMRRRCVVVSGGLLCANATVAWSTSEEVGFVSISATKLCYGNSHTLRCVENQTTVTTLVGDPIPPPLAFLDRLSVGLDMYCLLFDTYDVHCQSNYTALQTRTGIRSKHLSVINSNTYQGLCVREYDSGIVSCRNLATDGFVRPFGNQVASVGPEGVLTPVGFLVCAVYGRSLLCAESADGMVWNVSLIDSGSPNLLVVTGDGTVAYGSVGAGVVSIWRGPTIACVVSKLTARMHHICVETASGYIGCVETVNPTTPIVWHPLLINRLSNSPYLNTSAIRSSNLGLVAAGGNNLTVCVRPVSVGMMVGFDHLTDNWYIDMLNPSYIVVGQLNVTNVLKGRVLMQSAEESPRWSKLSIVSVVLSTVLLSVVLLLALFFWYDPSYPFLLLYKHSPRKKGLSRDGEEAAQPTAYWNE